MAGYAISSPWLFEILYPGSFYHNLCLEGFFPLFTLTRVHTLWNIYHCPSSFGMTPVTLMYLDKGLFSYLEHSSTWDSLRRNKEKMLTHIKNWLFPGGSLSFFNLASFPVFLQPCRSEWDLIRGTGAFLAWCLSSSTWIKLPSLIESCLESCSVCSQKQITSVLGLCPRLPGD